MKITAEPRSDQWNADDFIVGSKTFTIADVTVGVAEQKYDIILDEGQGRSWRPPLTVIRILLAVWGDESDDWVGRRVTLFRDESIRFGADTPGGVRVSHMSHLPGGKTFTIKLTKSKGQKQTHRIEPLVDVPPPSETPSLGALFDQAGLPKARGDDRITITRKIVGRPDITSAADLTKDELASLTAQLAEWDRDGTLTDKVGDILDLSTIEAESAK